MATITKRSRKDGSTTFRAEIKFRRAGRVIFQESKTFAKRSQAARWALERESKLEGSKEIEQERARRRLRGTRITDLIKRYRKEVAEWRPIGRSKESHLKFLENTDLAQMDALSLTSGDIVQHIRMRRKYGASASTANNDIIWLRVVYKYARGAWNLPLKIDAIEDATSLLRTARLISKSKVRRRRPTLNELEALTEYFRDRDLRSQIPMHDIMWFAIHSARRQGEICSLLWADNHAKTNTGLVRNLKHPTDDDYHKAFKYTPEAWQIVQRQPKVDDRIFPFAGTSVSSAFTNACHVLDVDDLRFHDLRHEATSRLFEDGYSIVEVQQFTLHESWATLKRYTNLRPEDVVTRKAAKPRFIANAK